MAKKDNTNYMDYAKSGIHIKPENKGKFTAYKKRTGKTTEEALHSKNPHVRKMANFARNSSKWRHAFSGDDLTPPGVKFIGGANNVSSVLGMGNPNTIVQNPNQTTTPNGDIIDKSTGKTYYKIHDQTNYSVEPITPDIQSKKKKPNILGDVNLGLSLIDAGIPTNTPRMYYKPQNVPYYNPYPAGTGSQAIMGDGGEVEDPKKKKPIIVNDKNDPRLRSYQDSLMLYNSYYELLNKNNLSEKDRISREKLKKQEEILIKEGDKYKTIKRLNPTFKNPITPLYIDTYPSIKRIEKNKIVDGIKINELTTDQQGFEYYKKPIQPIIYQEEQFPIRKPVDGKIEETNRTLSQIDIQGNPKGVNISQKEQYPTSFVASWRDENLPDKTAKKYFNTYDEWKKFVYDNPDYKFKDAHESGDKLSANSTGILKEAMGGNLPGASGMLYAKENPTNYMKMGGSFTEAATGISLHSPDSEIQALSPSIIKFDGAYHGEKNSLGSEGIPMTFAGKNVEVEHDETGFINDEGGLTILGNMKNPLTGNKFKKDGKILAKQENKYTTHLSKASDKLNELDTQNPFEMMSFNTQKAKFIKASNSLQDIDNKKNEMAYIQKAMLDYSRRNNIPPENLTKTYDGIDIKSLPTLQQRLTGQTYSDKYKDAQSLMQYLDSQGFSPADQELNSMYEKAKSSKNPKDVLAFQQKFHTVHPNIAQNLIENRGQQTAYGKKMGYAKNDLRNNEDGIFGKTTEQYHSNTPQGLNLIGRKRTITPAFVNERPLPENDNYTDAIQDSLKTYENTTEDPKLEPQRKKYTNANPNLGIDEITDNLYSLATNHVQPVQAQKFTPLLEQPFEYSFQDRRNQVQANYNALATKLGGNAAALATLQGQTNEQLNPINADEFRFNQGEKARVYNQNRQLLNDAELKNIGLLDQQYVRQEQARANTRRETLDNLTNLTEKVAQKKADAAKLAVYENMYNYRFDPNNNYKAENFNYTTFNTDGSVMYSNPQGSTSVVRDGNGNIVRSTTRTLSPLQQQKQAVDLQDKQIDLRKNQKNLYSPKKYGGNIVRQFKKYS